MKPFHHLLLAKYPFKTIIITVCIIFCAGLFPDYLHSLTLEGMEDKIEKERQDLVVLKEQMRLQELQIAKSRSRERSVLAELEEIDRQRMIKEKELNIYDASLKLNEQKKRILSEKLQETEENIQRQRKLLQNRLRAIYKQGDLSYLKIIFSSSGFNDLIERYKFMYLIAQADTELIQGFKNNLAALKKAQENLKEVDARIVLYKDKALKKQWEIEEEKKKKKLLLTRVRDEKITHEIAHKELGLASVELEDLIKDLEKNKGVPEEREKEYDAKNLKGLQQKKGRLSWPAKGTIISEFGNRENPERKIPRFNNGIEIKVPFGSNVRSVETGGVIYSGWLKGYGNMLILDHGKNFYSLYAHNSELFVEKGDMVAPQQIIAKAGDSGSLEGPSLYFELRHFWKPLSPREWLQKE
jgi:septal ring factor EnvC (AmiA/AmiB activator)